MFENCKNEIRAFSMAEMMVVMLIVSVMLAAAAPIITKRATAPASTAAATSSSDPVGTVVSYIGATAPPGWLLCDGQTYQLSAIYKKLHDALPSTMTTQTTFTVPDLRGEFVRGLDNG